MKRKRSFNLFIIVLCVTITMVMLFLKNSLSPFLWFIILLAFGALSMFYGVKSERDFKKSFEKHKDNDKIDDLNNKNPYI